MLYAHTVRGREIGNPPHSDNEESIVPGSDIITVSIGSSKTQISKTQISFISIYKLNKTHKLTPINLLYVIELLDL